MAAGTYDFTIEQGTTFDLKLEWTDSEDVPVDLTGYSARMQVRETKASVTKLAEFKTDDDTITLDDNGEIHILASDTVTSAWDWPVPSGQVNPQGVYDLELESAGGVVTRLIEGTITLSPEVTR